jgi:hypothetical protein
MTARFLCFASFLSAASAKDDVVYPPFKAAADHPERGAGISRTLTLLESSAVERKNTVRILFYGQSITEQSWWEEAKQAIGRNYPLATLEVENRAIGGHSSQLLCKTAEADLYPFYPDVVIFHVYGAHDRYEDIIRRIRERTTAEILMQTDHPAGKDTMDEVTDPAKLSPEQWNPWMNYVFLPATAKKYGCELLPVRDLWKQYLTENRLTPRSLLKDEVHLNDHGCFLMAEIVKSAFAPLKAPVSAAAREMVREIPLTNASWRDGKLTVPFEGNRVDGVYGGVAANTGGAAALRIDGRPPEEIRQLYSFTRASAWPGSNWPCLLRVQRGPAQLLDEEWTVTLAWASDDYRTFQFSLTGSKTGPDGIGTAAKKFVSKSGRVVIDPDDWNLQYCRKVLGRKLPDGFRITWKSVPRWSAMPLVGSTFVQGLNNGKHTLELSGEGVQNSGLTALRVYRPPFPQTEDPAADASRP